MASRNRFCRQYLQNLNALIFWFNYLQKVNAMPLDFWWKKFFLSLWEITFDPLKKEKNLFRNQGQFQIRRQCSRNCPLIVFCPQIWKTKKNSSLQKLRAITVYFWDEVFSLGMPSVCPHLTTVYKCLKGPKIENEQSETSKNIIILS